jgi:hypothetical protein
MVVGVALTAFGAAGCGGGGHHTAITEQKPATVAAVVQTFDHQGIQLMRLTARSAVIRVVVTSAPDSTGKTTTTEMPAGFPGPGPAYLGWFEAFDERSKGGAMLDVRVYRSPEVASRAARMLRPQMDGCWRHNNVLLCEYYVSPSSRPWLGRALRTLNHF